MSGEKNTVYTTFCAKTTEKRVKNKQEKNRAPITKFFGVTWFEKRKPNKPRTKTKVKQYYNQPISLCSKSKPTPPHGSSSSFTSLTPSYCFCFLLHKNQKPKTKKKKAKPKWWVAVSPRFYQRLSQKKNRTTKTISSISRLNHLLCYLLTLYQSEKFLLSLSSLSLTSKLPPITSAQTS